jgi:NADPH2:quinone reductase
VAWGTAHDCLFEFGRLRAGESVLIQAGGSGVGLACVQLAKRAGATVFATAGSKDKLERLAALGVDHGICYREVDFVEAVQKATQSRGVNLVVDAVGDTLQRSLLCLGYRGRAITVGNASRSDMKIDPSPLASARCSTRSWPISRKASSRWWSTVASRSPRPRPRTPTSRAGRRSGGSC